jgi:phage terminase small subunit
MPQLEDPKREAFALAYAETRNGPLALLRAGYSPGVKHYSLSSAKDITARIQELWETQFAEANITPERVMKELERIAFQDIRPIFDSEGNLKPMHQLDDDVAATIASVDVETRWEGKGEDAVPVYTKKVRRVDKMAALGILARHFKIVGDDNEGVNALASALADRLKAARGRAFGQSPAQPVTDITDAVEVLPAALPTPGEAAPSPTLPVIPATITAPAKPAFRSKLSPPKTPEESDDEQLW